MTFKYVLDVKAITDEASSPAVWRSNEVEASIDCGRHTVSVRKLVAYPGPKASGSPTAVHTFTSTGTRPQRISAKSTFAYLESHVCGGG